MKKSLTSKIVDILQDYEWYDTSCIGTKGWEKLIKRMLKLGEEYEKRLMNSPNSYTNSPKLKDKGGTK